jgi:hypothetical protein
VETVKATKSTAIKATVAKMPAIFLIEKTTITKKTILTFDVFGPHGKVIDK